MKSYGVFADFYDLLTLNVEYEKRADYLMRLFEKFDHKTGICLDLACGTGSLTVELAKRGLDIYGVDGSMEMLSFAQEKSYENGLQIMFLCQKMQNIDLYGTINTCVCSLDSINHLTKLDDVQKTFDRVSLFMEKDGLFVFDVNTVYKHKSVLSNNNFVFDTDEVYCVWQNCLGDENVVEINLDFFVPEKGGYKRFSESFCERAYSDEEIRKMLKNSDFELLGAFGDMTFDSPSNTEQRVIYAAKKIHSPKSFEDC